MEKGHFLMCPAQQYTSIILKKHHEHATKLKETKKSKNTLINQSHQGLGSLSAILNDALKKESVLIK